MKKIPTIFLRDFDNDPKYVTRERNPACAWVFAGKGSATWKWDGTCVLLDDDGAWWARREVKPGRATPPGFVVVEHDDATGKTVGWEPAEQSSFAKYLREAVEGYPAVGELGELQPGTYELCGPKVNGNPEGFGRHVLVKHGLTPVEYAPRDYDGLADFFAEFTGEGIVWHHPDGRMAKLKRRDFPAATS